MAEIVWKTGTTRHRLDIPVKGNVPAPKPTVEEDLANPPTVVAPAPQAQPARKMIGAQELARRRARAAMTQPSLKGGVGVVEMDTQTLASLDPASARRLRIIDENLETIGVQWSQSARPVDLTAVIIENAPIHVVITQRVNAAYGGPVTAMVQKPVWGGHGRARVIERGARVIGYTRGITGFGTASGNRTKGNTNVGTATVGGARLNVDWKYLMRPDGAAFNVQGEIATGDLMGAQGLPVILDPYEWERYIAIIGNAGIRALSILASPEKQLVKTITTTETGETKEGFEHIPTQNELAALEIVTGLKEATLVMQALTTPQPAIVLPAGTRGVLSPLRGLVLKPITEVPRENEGIVPGSMAAEELAQEIARKNNGMRTRSPQEIAKEEEEEERGTGQNTENMEEFQRPPESFERTRDRITNAPQSDPDWREQAQEHGVEVMSANPTLGTGNGQPLPAPRKPAEETTVPAWAKAAKE